MILNNMKRAIAGSLCNVSSDYIMGVNVNGENQCLAYSGYINAFKNMKNVNNYGIPDGGAFLLGTGTGEITSNDYCLFELFEDYSTVEQNFISCYSDTYRKSNSIAFLTRTITNTSDSAVTITECGWCAKYDRLSAVLLTHDLLSTPLVLEPNETGTITVEISIE